MIHRRRIAFLLDRLGLFVFGPFRDEWRSISQEQLNERIDAAEHPSSLGAR